MIIKLQWNVQNKHILQWYYAYYVTLPGELSSKFNTSEKPYSIWSWLCDAAVKIVKDSQIMCLSS